MTAQSQTKEDEPIYHCFHSNVTTKIDEKDKLGDDYLFTLPKLSDVGL